MHWSGDWQSGWFLGMHVAWWIFWIIAAMVLWATITRWVAPPTPKSESPLELLDRRYAEGGLSTEEYEERRARLLAVDATVHSP